MGVKLKKEAVKRNKVILFPFILILLLFYLIAITSAKTYQTIGSDLNTTSAFFNNVTYNASGFVQLNRSTTEIYMLRGNYTSQIIDFNYTTSFNNFTWGPGIISLELPSPVGLDSSGIETTRSTGGFNISNLLFLYHFNNGSDESWSSTNGSLKDYSSLENAGNITFSNSSNPNILVDGKFSNTLYFDGKSTVINITNKSIFSPYSNNYAFSGWFKTNHTYGTGTTQIGTIFGAYATSSLTVNTLEFRIQNVADTNTFAVRIGDDDGQQYQSELSTLTGPLNDDKWHFFVVNRPAIDRLQIAIDGKILVNGSATNFDDIVIHTGMPMQIGKNPISYPTFFNGSIDELAYWNRSLTEYEIEDLYKRGLTLKFQLRTCDDSACDTETFKGPDNTSVSYYENATINQLNNSVAGTNRYLQYIAYFERLNAIKNFTTELYNFTLNAVTSQRLNLVSPSNNSQIVNNSIQLNTTMSTNNTLDSDLYVFAGNSTNLNYNNLILINKSIGTDLNLSYVYNFTSLPVKPQPDGSDGLILLYHFDNITSLGEGYSNGTNSTIVDYSTSRLNATKLSNASADGPEFNHSGKYGGGLSLDGTYDFLTVQDTAILEPTSISAFAWINPSVVSGTHHILKKGSLSSISGTNGYHLRVSGSAMQVVLYTGVGTQNLLSGGTINANRVYHVGFTYDGTTAYLYINGAVVDSAVISDSIDYTGADQQFIMGISENGGSGFTSPFQGMIDEVSIWNRSLSINELRRIFARNYRTYYWKANSTSEAGLIETPIFNFNMTLPPTNPSPSISPASPIKSDNLNCSYTFVDIDTDDIGTATIIWYNSSREHKRENFTEIGNGTFVSYTLERNATNGFIESQTWTCAARTNDGMINSGSWINTSVTIQNSPPDNASGNLLPEPFATLMQPNSSLNGSVFLVDPDGENMILELVFWNGSEEHFRRNFTSAVNATNRSYTLVSNETNLFSKGENWTLAFASYDGSRGSGWSNKSIIINNTIPNSPNTTIITLNPSTQTDFNCSSTYLDRDDDSGTATFIFYNDSLEHYRTNISIGNATANNTITSYTLINNATNTKLVNQNWTCAIRITDENEPNTIWINDSSVIVAGNTAPSSPNQTFNPSLITRDVNLNCTGTYLDVDNDVGTMSISFYNGSSTHFTANISVAENNTIASYTLTRNQSNSYVKNETWTCAMKAADNSSASDDSAWINISALIGNIMPENVSVFTFIPSSVDSDNTTFNFTFNGSDRDISESLTAEMVFWNNSIVFFRANFTQANNSVYSYITIDNASNVFVANNNITVSVRIYDNNVSGQWQNDSIIVSAPQSPGDGGGSSGGGGGGAPAKAQEIPAEIGAGLFSIIPGQILSIKFKPLDLILIFLVLSGMGYAIYYERKRQKLPSLKTKMANFIADVREESNKRRRGIRRR